MKKLVMTFIVTIVAMLAFVGCGGGGPAPVEVAVSLTEFAYSPSGIQAEAGAEVTATISNDGALEHNFIVMDKDVIVTEWTDADQANVYYEQLALPAGQNTVATFTAPTVPGTYQLLCSVPGHLAQGMQGTLTVIAP
jgi:uncharacterized cupredoxin-like copper-binding protein